MRKRKKTKKAQKQRTILFVGLGIASKLLLIAVIIHYIIVLLQGDFHPMLNSVKTWITTYVYNGPLAELVQPLCEKIWEWKYTDKLFELTGIPALLASIIIRFFQWYIKDISVVSENEKRSGVSWRSGGIYRHPSLSPGRKIYNILKKFYSGTGKDLVREAESMAICRVLYDGREASQDMNTVREWRLDELLQRKGEQIKVLYDRREKKMTFLLPDGSVRILNSGESFTWKFEEKSSMEAMFL